MEQWQRVSLILYLFGFLKDFRPSEPFMVEFVTGPEHNITVEQVVQEALPVGTYSYVTILVVAFLITDYFRYKPMIIVSGLAGTVVWCLFVWSRSLEALKVVQFFYGMFLATEIGFFSYIYTRVDRNHYQKITSYIRSGTLAGRFLASAVAQFLIYFSITDYLGLNYMSLGAQLLITGWSFFLPPAPASIYFHHREPPSEEQIELKSDKPQPVATAESTCNRATTLLWAHFKYAYTNFTVIRYSLWNALALCVVNQTMTYVQALWSTIGGPNTVFWNGAVDAALTLMGSLVALLAGYVPQRFLKLHITLPSLSMIAILEGLALMTATGTSNLIISYVSYIMLGILNAFAGTLVTSEIAKHISDDSFALIFGINNVVGLTMQSIFTLAVVDSNGWFALDIRGQFTVCSYLFFTIGLLYITFLVAELCRRRKLGENPLSEPDEGQTMKLN